MSEHEGLRNWAGNLRYSTKNLHIPATLEDVQECVVACNRLRVLGSRHSFNSIADSTQNLLSMERFQQIGTVDRERMRVTIGGGVRYGDLCGELHRQGFAIPNLASLPHISVAGACATATHGSGDNNGNLATAVAGIEFVLADGTVRYLDRERPEDREAFAGSVVNLGALGVVTELALAVVPTFWIRQDLFQNVTLSTLNSHSSFDALFGDAYSVSLFTDWKEAVFTQAWRKSLVSDMTTEALQQDLSPDPHAVPDTALMPSAETPTASASSPIGLDTATKDSALWFGASLAGRALHPIPDNSPETCTAQGVPGPWHRRLPHFRMDFTPSNGSELQSEYLVPRTHILEALHAIADLRGRIAPLLLTSEIRTIAADDLWMSTCYGQPRVAIHFTWKQDWPGVSALLPDIETALAPFGARPHWGKLFLMSGQQLAPLYPRWQDFVRLMATYDPAGKFRNDFIENLFEGNMI